MIPVVFPTVNNVPIYKSKSNKLYYGLVVTDTPYTVNSHGFDAHFYVCPTTANFSSTNLKWKSNVPLIKLYTGKAFPAEVAPDYYSGNSFGVKYTGYFTESAAGTFYLYGEGKARLLIGAHDTGTISLTQLRSSTCSIQVSGIGADEPITIYYLSPGRQSAKDNMFSVSWKSGTYTTPIPLCAGLVKSLVDYTDGVSSWALDKIGNITLDRGQNKGSSLTFEIPLVRSTASVGYYYDATHNRIQHTTNSTIKIAPFKKIEFHCGYVTSVSTPAGTVSAYDLGMADHYGSNMYDYNQIVGTVSSTSAVFSTCTKFVGQIRSFDIRRDKQKAVAQIECLDWWSFLSDSFNEGYPNRSDYTAFNLVDTLAVGNVSGDTKPTCFDGWDMYKAIDCLLINANIDPTLLWKKQKDIGVDETVITTDYYKCNQKSLTDVIMLDRKFRYGNPLSVGNGPYSPHPAELVQRADDKYIWQFSVGDPIKNCIDKIVQKYSFTYGFDHVGDFYTRVNNSPVFVHSIDSFNTHSNWVSRWHPKFIKAQSYVSDVIGATLSLNYSGTHAQLVVERNETAGTISVTVTNPTLGLVYTASLLLNYNKAWRFYSGHDDFVGYNPCVFNLDTNNIYGNYNLVVTNTATSTVKINGLLVYNSAYNAPSDILYTSDAVNKQAVISQLSNKQDASELRNDIVVVGALKGLLSPMAQTQEGEINPNNPISNHVIARAVDRASIGSLLATNYVGRKLQTIIIDPQFTTEEHAQWMAVETGKRYNEMSKTSMADLTFVGQPRLEPNDYIQISDDGHRTISTVYDFWVTSCTDSFAPSGVYSTSVKLSAFRPWDSYFHYPTPSVLLFPEPVVNIVANNFGLPLFDDEYSVIASSQKTVGTSTAVTTLLIAYYAPNIQLPVYTAIGSVIASLLPQKGYISIGNSIDHIYGDEVVYYNGFIVDAQYSNSVSLYKVQDTEFPPSVGINGVHATITLLNVERGVYTVARELAKNQDVRLSVSPYITEEESIAPEVLFDLLYDGYVRVAVYSINGILLDVLSGEDDDISEQAGWQYLRAGTYSYKWGMVDRVGMYNQSNAGYFTDAVLSVGKKDRRGTGRPAKGVWTNEFEGSGETHVVTAEEDARWGITRDKYQIGSGYYAHNKWRQFYGNFAIDIRYMDLTRRSFKREIKATPHHNIYTAVYNRINEEGRSGAVLQVPNAIRWLAPDSYFGDYESFERSALTGNNDRLKIVTNGLPGNRLVKVKIDRKILVMVWRWDVSVSAMTTKVFLYDDDPIIDTDYFYYIANSDGFEVVLPPPKIPFLTPDVFETVNVQSVSGVAHVHLLKTTVTDFSGRRDVIRNSYLYVDPQFAVQTNKMFDGVTDNTPIRFYDNSPGGYGKYIIVEGVEGEYWPFIKKQRSIDDANVKFLAIMPERIMGVLLSVGDRSRG